MRNNFTSFHGYDMFMKEDQINIERRYAFRSEVFLKKIEAHNFSNNLEVT